MKQNVFKHFPNESICPICGTNDDTKCTLIPIDDTGDGRICETMPVHVSCLSNGWRFNKSLGIVYKVTRKEEEKCAIEK